MDDTPSTAQLVADRREQLRKYRAVFAETYGYAIDPGQHEAGDGILRELLAGSQAPNLGRPVVIDRPGHPLHGVTGRLLATEDGMADVKADRGGAIYRTPTNTVRVTP